MLLQEIVGDANFFEARFGLSPILWVEIGMVLDEQGLVGRFHLSPGGAPLDLEDLASGGEANGERWIRRRRRRGLSVRTVLPARGLR